MISEEQDRAGRVYLTDWRTERLLAGMSGPDILFLADLPSPQWIEFVLELAAKAAELDERKKGER